jgi:hypothetical protein
VFGLPWSRSHEWVCDPASRSWLTSSGVAFHPTAPSEEEPDRPTMTTRRIADLSTDPACLEPKLLAKTVRCSAALLGSTTRASRFALRTEVLRTASRLRKIDSSGASSRLAPLPLPKEPRHCRPAEIGTWGLTAPILPLPAVWGGWNRRPDHQATMHLAPESSKRKIR